MRWSALLRTAPLLVVACGSGAEPVARPVVSTKPSATAAPLAKCPKSVDVADLLARHARGFGSVEAVAKGFPLTFLGEAEIEGQKGRAQLVLGAAGYRGTTALPSFFNAWGRDGAGLWGMRGSVGVVERTPNEHETTEATENLLEEWIWHRGYTKSSAAQIHATCNDETAAPRVDVAFERADLGAPVLAFDLANAGLLSITRRDPTGARLVTTIATWTEADESGVRWPRKLTEHPPTGSSMTVEYAKVTKGWACERLEPSGPESAPIAEGCLAPPSDRFVIRWPEKTPVRVPFTLFRGQILVRAKIGGRDVWALFDSGAGVTVVDATTTAGQAFKPKLEIAGAGATQKIKLGFGELPSIAIGDLRADTIPTASVPIPALDSFGAKRPELILGYSFFAATVTRIDYKKGELVFAKKLDGLVATTARSHPLRVIDGKLFADATIEGHRANMMVDTGSSGALDITKKWATAHGIPGDRRAIEVKGLFGAGTAETPATFFRAGEMTLGPIKIDNALTSAGDGPGEFAGMAGNEAFARCDAMILDREGRKLWFEGACDRIEPEHKLGWRFTKKIDPKLPDNPWVVLTLFPGGGAEAAGIKIGDRILEIQGRSFGLDIEPFDKLEQGKDGTKLSVVVLRAESGKKEKVVVELRSLLGAK